MSQRLSETVFRVLQLSKPTFVNGRWRKPSISRRELAEMRKYLLSLGAEWPEKKLRDRGADKPYKLTKWERGREARSVYLHVRNRVDALSTIKNGQPCERAWLTVYFNSSCRKAAISDNMAKMPQMIADYRKKVHDQREAIRKKNRRTEEEEYMLATGKKTQEGPAWQIFKDAAKRK